jgi:hypothetical protein
MGCPLTFAQETWNGLKFGTTVAEVQASISKRGSDLKREKGETEEGWRLVPDWDVQLPGLSVALHFMPHLYFSNSGKLERIWLELDTAKHKAENVDPAESLTYGCATALHNQLVAKYGRPVSQTGVCERVKIEDLVLAPKADCEALWRASGQTVKLRWIHGRLARLLLVHIVYVVAKESGL